MIKKEKKIKKIVLWKKKFIILLIVAHVATMKGIIYDCVQHVLLKFVAYNALSLVFLAILVVSWAIARKPY